MYSAKTNMWFYDHTTWILCKAVKQELIPYYMFIYYHSFSVPDSPMQATFFEFTSSLAQILELTPLWSCLPVLLKDLCLIISILIPFLSCKVCYDFAQ